VRVRADVGEDAAQEVDSLCVAYTATRRRYFAAKTRFKCNLKIQCLPRRMLLLLLQTNRIIGT
jgi:hypothetical protein